jgi:hypothetical protein
MWTLVAKNNPRKTLYLKYYQTKIVGNIYCGNQPLCANYGNFNLNHMILIQGRTHERWEG